MSFPIRAALAAVALASAMTIAQAQTAQDQDHTVHHPEGQAAAPAQPPALRMPGQPPMGPGGQQQMMGGDMSQMMGMMHGMMMQGRTSPMDSIGLKSPFAHIEGQIAFYRAELRITDAQAPLWNGFADVLRANAKTMQTAFARAAPGSAPGTIIEQIDRRSALLTVQLDALKAMAAAGKPLYAAFSDEQKKLADELLADHFRRM
jgi:hypothetical protein